MNKPVISVIIPVYNEAGYIEQMVTSVLNQEQQNFTLELLIVDGASTDGTADKIKQLQKANPFIQIIENEKRIAPAAFNKGIQQAKGEYIAILGAHSRYDSNYLEVCLKELATHNCAGCSGRIEVAKNESSMQSMLIFYLLTSSFGVSTKSYRTAKEGISEQCPYPVFKRSVFDAVGMYNELLVRNQDNDMNYRIIKAGNKLYYTHKVSAYYYPKQTLKSLFAYAITTGKWNAASLRINPGSMSLRHVVPFVFTSLVIVLSFLSLISLFFFTSYAKVFFIPLLAILLFHLLTGIFAATALMIKNKSSIVLILPVLFFSFHFLYGFGTLKGFFNKQAKIIS